MPRWLAIFQLMKLDKFSISLQRHADTRFYFFYCLFLRFPWHRKGNENRFCPRNWRLQFRQINQFHSISRLRAILYNLVKFRFIFPICSQFREIWPNNLFCLSNMAVNCLRLQQSLNLSNPLKFFAIIIGSKKIYEQNRISASSMRR